MRIYRSLLRVARRNPLYFSPDVGKKVLLLTFSCLLASLPVHGQGIEVPDYKQAVISPQAALMNMYGDYPVDLANGLVDISIPLHEVSTSWFSFPISAKFHASGLRANEQEGVLGVRWLMDATYSITRSVRGYPDDQMVAIPPPYHSFDNRVDNPYFTPDFDTLWGTTYIEGAERPRLTPTIIPELSNYNGPEGYWKDTEYDIYTYHLPSGKSGKFILRDSAGVKIPCTLPYEPLKIEVSRSHPTSVFTQFRITDENGVTYRYKIGDFDERTVQEWRLETIVSADQRDSIIFEYNHYLTRRIPPRMIEARVVQDHFGGIYENLGLGGIIDEDGPIYDFFDEEYRSPHSEYIVPPVYLLRTNYHLSAIRFKGGKVEFNYGSEYGSRYLSFLEVFDHSSTAIKKIAFTYMQPVKSGTVDEKAVLLDKLAFINPRTGAGDGEEYRFDYYNAEHYPSTPTNYQTEMESDWWGYYLRGADNLILEEVPYRQGVFHWRNKQNPPFQQQTVIGKKVFDKNSNIEDMKVCMLKSIEYPTGGKTIFHYESNRYLSRNNVSTPCGGLRIQKMENIAASGQAEFKTYKYNPHKGGNGTMPSHLYPPDPRGGTKNFLTETISVNEFRWNDPTGWYDPTVRGIMAFEYSNYLYSNVLPAQFSIFTSNTVYYEKVVEYWGTESASNGYTEHEFSIILPETQLYTHLFPANRTNEYNSRQFLHVMPPAYGEGAARLYKKTVYNKNGQPLEESTYSYTGFNKGSVYDMPIQRLWYYKLGGLLVLHDDPQYCADRIKVMEMIKTEYTDYEQFAWLNQEYRLGASRLTNETVKHYTDNGIVTTVKAQEYDPVHLLPVKETVSSTGSGETFSTTYRYPHQTTGQAYTEMVRRNILSPVIEKAVYKGTTFLEKGITNYRLWGPNHYAPQNFQRQRQNGTLETRLVYDYSPQTGHLNSTVKDGLLKVVYIRNAYGEPVAVIDQADYSQVTGLLGSTLVNRIANSFVVSSSDMAALDRLRGQLPNALVSTYTYKPLVGILTATDPSGIVTRYEYDDQGRLKHIFDVNGHVVEKYDYHYVNP